MSKRIPRMIKEFFLTQDIPPLDHTFLLACSGGIDSMVMADVLLKMNIPFTLAHCNFNLRGTESDGDEEFVREYARERNIPVHIRHFKTKTVAAEQGLSTQMAARQLRYDFFEILLKEENYDYLITAHHCDDSLETILINLGRGTGFSGLKGIEGRSGKILRPLISAYREDLLQYATDENIQWREDSSNKKEDYQRNFIRHRVIPPLRKAFPNFRQGLTTSLENIQSDYAFFKENIRNKLEKLVENREGREYMNISELKENEGFMSLLHHWLSPYSGFNIPSIAQSLYGESGKVFESHSHQLLKDREFFILRKKDDSGSTVEYIINESDIRIDEPLSLEFKIVESANFDILRDNNTAGLDFDLLEFPLRLRKWKTGDKFIPLGMNGFKKMSDFFIDEKLSLFEKENTWLLTSGKNTIWVIGHRIDNRYRITDKTKRVYFVRCIN